MDDPAFHPSAFTPEITIVWSFPDRGDWATHVGNYRCNWSPYNPRNLILRYTAQGELVFDQMAGSETTLVECKLLGRRAVGVDINPDAVMVARNRLDFAYTPLDSEYKTHEIKTTENTEGHRDKTTLSVNSVPSVVDSLLPSLYASIIPYSHIRVEGDLSSVHNIAEFAEEMRKVAVECMRVLMSFLGAGFILREDMIKLQWKRKSTREKWFGKKE